MDLKKLQGVTGFQWDQGNLEKNWVKHGVSPLECEQLFFNQPLVVAPDLKHSHCEERFYALGRTDSDRFLFVVFTVRAQKLRIISARDMNRKERNIYGA
jgi:uncharacterized DUF497 family protein